MRTDPLSTDYPLGVVSGAMIRKVEVLESFPPCVISVAVIVSVPEAGTSLGAQYVKLCVPCPAVTLNTFCVVIFPGPAVMVSVPLCPAGTLYITCTSVRHCVVVTSLSVVMLKTVGACKGVTQFGGVPEVPDGHVDGGVEPHLTDALALA
jgi:hypothetical protein